MSEAVDVERQQEKSNQVAIRSDLPRAHNSDRSGAPGRDRIRMRNDATIDFDQLPGMFRRNMDRKVNTINQKQYQEDIPSSAATSS